MKKLFKKESFGTELVMNPAKNLFVWALLLNRIETAKIFWKIGEVGRHFFMIKQAFKIILI